jgi:hypothetical protein
LDLWNRIHDEEVRRNPDSSAGDVRSAAWRRFQSVCWVCDAKQGPAAVPREEYETLDAGPDLTTLCRMRFRVRPKPKRPRAKTGYSIYLKTSLQEHKADWADLAQKERVTRIAAAWNAMSKDEKANYAVKE